MKRTAFVILFLIISLILPAQEKKKKDKKEKEKKEKKEKEDIAEKAQVRPVSPWIFEGGLDEKPGRVVAALNKNLWLAYDTSTCSVFRIWRGSAFVNTSSANKDMVIDGFHFLETPGTEPVWKVKKGAKEVKPQVKLEKYGIEEDRFVLTYKFSLEDGSSFYIKESPEYVLKKRPDINRITLQRRFTVENAAADVSVMLAFEASDLVKLGDLKSSSKILDFKKSKRMYDWGDVFNVEGELLLNTNKKVTLTTTFTMDAETYFSTRPSSN